MRFWPLLLIGLALLGAAAPPSSAATADLSITKDDGVTGYLPGGTVVYTIVVTNEGPDAVLEARVTDDVKSLPQVDDASWTCEAEGGAVCDPGPKDGDIDEDVDLPVDGTVTYTLTVWTEPLALGDLVNTATIAVPFGVTDPEPSNNSATDIDVQEPNGAIEVHPAPNLELVPAGSLVIAMDNHKQNLGGDPFNLAAYGLVTRLLWDEIPIKWAIRAGKAKDERDFIANASRLFPTALPPAMLEFRGGPFIVHRDFAAVAQPRIAAFGNAVTVYELVSDTTIDVRHTFLHKPKVATLNDGGNAKIHRDILLRAGFVPGLHFDEIDIATLASINATSCFTFASEPHFDSDSAGPQVEALRSFLQSGANFLAQCAAIASYENDSTHGLFQTTAGVVEDNSGSPALLYPNPDVEFSQFEGPLEDTGGSISDYHLAPGSLFHNDGQLHVQHTPLTGRYTATASKLQPGLGSHVFYLGGHEYGDGDVEDINGQRMYLNAAMLPAARPADCGLSFTWDRQITGTVYEDPDGDGVVTDGVGLTSVAVTLFRDGGDGLPDGGDDVELATTSTDGGGHYAFTDLTAGRDYWLRIDSTTIAPSLGLRGGFAADAVWAEQTHGPTGARCDDGSGGLVTLASSGPCHGGQQAEVSDDAGDLSTSEHVTFIPLALSVRDADFGFSFAAVVNTRDGDDAGGDRTIQGSLRQFLNNSNAINDVQASTFRIPSSSSGYDGTSYRIVPADDLPVLEDPLILDGTTQTGFTATPLIELDGTAGKDGLILTGGASTVRGLVINRFNGPGLTLEQAGGNFVRGNFIGTDAAGGAALPNDDSGILVRSPSNTIGGTAAGEGNLLSGNEKEGIKLDNASGGSLVQGNLIGTDVDGTSALGNNGIGIDVRGAGTTIGGTDPLAGNLISANAKQGIKINNNASATIVQGNRIGTTLDGTLPLGNAEVGIEIRSAGNTIGGTTAEARNVISDSGSHGVTLGNDASGNFVRGNSIGTDAGGTIDLGNAGAGVQIDSVVDNTIGGSLPGAGNWIAFNENDGVVVLRNALGNLIQRNSIYLNGELGIDLEDDGVTFNDPGDGDNGPNALQNFPLIVSVVVDGGSTTVSGTFDSTPGQDFELGFYADGSADTSGHGEGQRYLGSGTLNTGSGGPVPFSFVFPGAEVAGDEVVSSTASRVGVGTSEFSVVFTFVDLSGTIWEDVDGDGALDDKMPRPGADVIVYRDGGDGLSDGSDDTVYESTTTDINGTYVVDGALPGTYWVVVDSRTVTPSGGFNGGFGQDDVWAEQSYGSAGAECDDGAGGITLRATAGACHGGRASAVSDDATSLAGAQHVTRVEVASSAVSDIDVGFSFAPVVNTTDDADHDLTADRTVQGSLRQFIQNSNAIAGMATSLFRIPTSDLGHDGTGHGEFLIEPDPALPDISDPFVIDGTTQPGWTDRPLIVVDGGSAGNSDGLRITSGGSTVRGLVIQAFKEDGIDLAGPGGNVVQGSYIGVDVTGLNDAGNNWDGIRIASPDNLIGGGGPREANVVAGNGNSGVHLTGAAAIDNRVEGNLIGLGNDGVTKLANGEHGVMIDDGASGNTIGGTADDAGNVISGNGKNGIHLTGAGTEANRIQGNLVGTDAAGTSIVQNGAEGLLLQAGAATNTIGGDAAGAGNVISGSKNSGIRLTGVGTDGNVVQGNLVGTNAAADQTLPNGDSGILIEEGASNNTIGGMTAGAGNVIAGNDDGVTVEDPITGGNRIQGNYIGTNADGLDTLGNSKIGVLVKDSDANEIGGLNPEAGNVIAHNVEEGVSVEGTSTANAIRRNAIYDNGKLGIDLKGDGPTPNDPDDIDLGANEVQNYPDLTGAVVGGGVTLVDGTLDSTPGTSFDLEFFTNDAADLTGFGEGQRYLDTLTAVTDGGGDAAFSIALPALAAGAFVTVTATGPDGSTSEFSAARPVSAGVDLAVTKTDGVTSAASGSTLTYTITVTNHGPGDVSGARVTDTFDPTFFDVAGLSWTCSVAGTGSCADAGPSVGDIDTTVDLSDSDVATFIVTAPTLPAATGTVSNTATVAPPAAAIDTDDSNNSATDADTELLSADLSIDKDDGVASYTPGGSVTYTILVSNAGPSGVSGATVTDLVTSALQVASASWTCEASPGASCTDGPVAGDLTDSVDLPADASVTYTLVVDLKPDASGDLVNMAAVAAPADVGDPDATNDADTDTDTEGTPVADLQISKTDGVASYPPGGTVTYTIVVDNPGPSSVGGVRVEDPVMAFAQVTGASWSCEPSGGATCNAGPVTGDLDDTIDLPAGARATYTLIADIGPTANGDLINTAILTVPPGVTDPDPANNSASDTDTEGTATADLSVTKTDGLTSYTPGTIVSYEITVSNDGPAGVSGATVTDLVTALPQVASSSWHCSPAGSANCTPGPVVGDLTDNVDIPIGDSVTYTLDVQLRADANGDLANTVDVAPPSGTADPDVTNNSATDTDSEGAPVADVAVAKTDGVTSYTPGGALSYTITVSNNGPSDVTGVAVEDSVVGLSQVESASWDCLAAGGATCSAGPVVGDLADTIDLPVGGTATYTLDVVLRADASGDLLNTATATVPAGATDPLPGNNAASDTDTQGGAVADLSVSKDDGVASYTPGGSVTYTILVSNAGPSSVSGATVSDLVTSALQVASASWTCEASPGASCTDGPVAGDLTDSVDLPPDASVTYTLIVELEPDASGDLVNMATVAAPAGVGDPDPANDADTDTDTQGAPVADLQISKTDGVASYPPGGTVTYTIVVDNPGPSSVGGVLVEDLVTASDQVTGASWSCEPTGGATCNAGPVPGNLTDTIDLPAGARATYTLIADIDPVASGDLVNTAIVTVPPGATDPDPANNSASDTDTEGTATADLSVTKTDGLTSYTPGTIVSYTIIVGNAGPTPVSGATVTDLVTALPQVAGASWRCSPAGGATCTAGPVGGDLTDTIDLPIGSNATYTLDVQLRADANGDLFNTVDVTPPVGTADPNASNNGASDTDSEGAPVADVAVAKTDSVTSYTPGGTLSYTITVSNDGPSDVTGVAVEDSVLGLSQVESASWDCLAAGGATCSAGPVVGDLADTIDLPVGGTATYTLDVVLRADASGDLLNTAMATVPAGATDPLPGNNAASDTDTQGGAVADLSVSKDDGVASYTPGGSVTYTILVSNAGPSSVSGATVSDLVTSALQVASASWTCEASPGASCTDGPVPGDLNDSVDLPADTSVTYTLVVSLRSDASGNLVNVAAVSAPAGATDPNAANDSDDDTDSQGGAVADLAVTVDDGVSYYVPGGSTTYSIVVTNTGPSQVTGATVSDLIMTLPQVVGASWTCEALGGATCTSGPASGDLVDVIDLPVGASATYTMVVDIDPGASGDLVHRAEVTPPAGASDPVAANDTAVDTDSEASVADLQIVKDDGTASYTPGATTSYTIVVSNAGPSDVSGATVLDAVMALPQVVGASWTCTAANGATCTAGPVSGDLSDTIDLPFGSSATYELTVDIDAGAEEDLVNNATVTPPAGVVDPVATSNSASDTDTPGDRVADLSISKDDGTTSYTPGGALTYTIEVSNDGPSHITGAAVTDLVTTRPQVVGASWTCAAQAGASCTAGPLDGDLVDTVDLPVGGTATYTLVADVDPGASGDLTNTAAVVVPTGATDPDASNNDAADVDVPGAPLADLALTMSVDDPTPEIGAIVNFTVSLANSGPSNADTITVRDTLPDGYVRQTSAVSAGTYDAIGGLWTVGDLPAGATATLVVTAEVLLNGDLGYAAEIVASGTADPDSIPGNGTDNDEDDHAALETVPGDVDILRVTKQAGKRDVVLGEVVTYVVTIVNQYDMEIEDVSLVDLPPLGFKFVPGSARLNDTPIADPTGGRPLLFSIGTVPPFTDSNGDGIVDPGEPGHLVLGYQLAVGTGALPGTHTNKAVARNSCCALSTESRASVEMRPDALYDFGLIIGKVFDDRNRDGRQDPGEAGVANAMVALDDGTYALADDHGRFHFPAVKPGQRMLKVNRHSLPPNSEVPDPFQVLWVTPGLMARASFGVLLRDVTTTIGRPDEHGLRIAAQERDLPVEIEGNAETLSVFVNGQRLLLDTSEARLQLDPVDPVVQLTAGRFDRPITFSLEADRPEAIERWEIRILDGEAGAVHALEGSGPPPETVSWDGLDRNGKPVLERGIYQYQLEVAWRDGARATSARRPFGVSRGELISLRLTGHAFETGSDRLSREARRVLARAADKLQEHSGERIIIEGHTDAVGSAESNLELSRRRAQSALEYLVREKGLPPSRFLLSAYGEDRPVASNVYAEGRALNRRVEIRGEYASVERTLVTEAPRDRAHLAINGEVVELGELNEFRHRLDGDLAAGISIEAADSSGSTSRARLTLPSLSIDQPVGEFRLPVGTVVNGCRSLDEEADAPVAQHPDGADVICRIEGTTQPGNLLELQGHPLATDAAGRFAFDLPLRAGRNNVDLLARDPEGFGRVTNLEVRVAERDAQGRRIVIAQGIPPLSVQLPAQGARLASSTLPIRGHTEPGSSIVINGLDVEVTADGTFATVAELPIGETRVVVEVTDAQGRIGSIERDVEVARHQLFLLAFADGKLGQLSSDGAIEQTGLDEDEDLFTEGRLAFYLKGRIAGKYLITSALDTGKDEAEYLFRNVEMDDSNRLLRNLDPDKYYPIYGDSSTVVHDVETQGRFYLALDSDEIHAVVGNYPIALTGTELATFQRTLYGARFQYLSTARTRFGAPDTEVVLFANEVEQEHIRDELRATGGSLYYLSHADVIEGSEQVTLVVRDKNTGLTLGRQTQRQNVDYEIKYEEARLLFHRPISSVEQGGSIVDSQILEGHPVFIQVDYEIRLATLDKTGYGARLRRQIGDRVAVGGTHVRDELAAGSYELTGVDAELRLGEATRILAEHAESNGTDSDVFVSDDGGITYGTVAADDLREGSAWKLATEIDVGEWFDRPDRYRMRAYYKELEPGFSSAGNSAEQGTRKAGIDGSLTVTDKDTIRVRHDREERLGELAPGSVEEVDTSALQWEHNERRWGIAVEYFQTEQLSAAGDSLRDDQFAATRLWWRPTEKLHTRVDRQETLSGTSNDQTRLGVTYQPLRWLAFQVDGNIGSIGESARAGASITHKDGEVYLTKRLSDGVSGASETTVLGARSAIGPSSKIYTEYQWEDTTRGDQLISLLGLQRQWDPAPGMRFVLGGESANAESDTTDTRRTALNTSFAYSKPETLTALIRASLRWDAGEVDREQFLTVAQLDYAINDDLTALARFRLSTTENQNTGETEAELEERSVSMAYRPVAHDRLNSIFRYTRLLDQRPTSLLGNERRLWDVVVLDTSYQVTPRLEWLTKSALRKREERIPSFDEHTSRSRLLIQRINVNAWKPIYFGLEFRSLQELELDDERRGWLTEAAWRLHPNFRVGVGYNYTDFSDDLFSENDYSVRGWFLRVQGMY